MFCCITNKEMALERSIRQQNTGKVKKLLSKGADPNGYGSECDCSFLCLAITMRNPEMVRMLLQAGANAGQHAWQGSCKCYLHEYPLQIAAMQGCAIIVRILMDYGSNVNVGQDTKMGTPLHLAAKMGHKDVVALLLKNEADIIAIDRSLNTPLHLVAQYGCACTAHMLIHHGAPVNARNGDLFTPLHCAASGGSSTMVKLLLEHGADPTKVDSRNKSALCVASTLEVKQILEEHTIPMQHRPTYVRTAILSQASVINTHYTHVPDAHNCNSQHDHNGHLCHNNAHLNTRDLNGPQNLNCEGEILLPQNMYSRHLASLTHTHNLCSRNNEDINDLSTNDVQSLGTQAERRIQNGHSCKGTPHINRRHDLRFFNHNSPNCKRKENTTCNNRHTTKGEFGHTAQNILNKFHRKNDDEENNNLVGSWKRLTDPGNEGKYEDIRGNLSKVPVRRHKSLQHRKQRQMEKISTIFRTQSDAINFAKKG